MQVVSPESSMIFELEVVQIKKIFDFGIMIGFTISVNNINNILSNMIDVIIQMPTFS